MLRVTALIFFVSMTTAAAKLPNFVVFLTDDQGWGDLACYGHPEIKSPNLDQFAKEGVRFTQCYSACGVCSPSRSSILTGRTPYRNGVWRWIPGGHQVHLRESEITIAELLKEKGYDTCHAGKWHLNGHFNSDKHPQPDDHGFDHWLATQNNASPHHMNPKNYVRNGEQCGVIQGPSAVIAANEAATWLKNRKDKSAPFFMTVWTHEPHLPIESAPEFMAPYAHIPDEGIRQHHGNITQLDHAFGLLMKALDEQGYRDDTCVFYTSDNGPEGGGTKGRTRGSTGGLRGRKRSGFEGGIRVPGIVRYPAYFSRRGIKPGSESSVPVIGSDIFTTICALTDIPLPKDRTIDGANILPALEGRRVVRQQPLYWRTHVAPPECRVALRLDDWKIVSTESLSKFMLFDMKKDWQETTDLSASMPEKFEEMKALLIKHDAEVKAEGPDWWKSEPSRSTKKPGKRRKAAALPEGKDETSIFDVTRGGVVRKHPLGVELTGSGEAFAVRKLDQTISGKATFSLQYQSTSPSRTRNGMLVLGHSATNEGLFKIGTAIGLDKHVAYSGGWDRVQAEAVQPATFNATDLFEMKVEVNLETRECHAVINGVELDAELPADLKEISYVGIFTKATSTAFTEIVVSP